MLFKIINGKDICLRPLDDSCCSEKSVDWMNNIDINKYLEARWVSHNCESVKAFIKEIENSDHSIIFGIFRKIDSVHIGNIKIGPINLNHKRASIGILIGDKNEWGNGYASEAIQLVTEFGFEELSLMKITAGCYESNKGSKKAFEKSGYEVEGFFKSHVETQYGREGSWQLGIISC